MQVHVIIWHEVGLIPSVNRRSFTSFQIRSAKRLPRQYDQKVNGFILTVSIVSRIRSVGSNFESVAIFQFQTIVC